MSRLDKFVVAPMFMLFVLHGLLYFVFPDQHYASAQGNGGWLSYLKYLCLLISLPALIRWQFKQRIVIWLTIGIGLLTVPFCLQLYWVHDRNLPLLQFQMAATGYFFAPFLIRFWDIPGHLNRYVFAILLISFLAAIGEIVLGGPLVEFSRSGFRSMGAFINPNNTGIVVAILAAIYHHEVTRKFSNAIVAVLVIATLAATGSKTAMVIYAIGIVAIRPIGWRVFLLSAVPLGMLLNAINVGELWSLLEMREMSLESGDIRSKSISNVFHILGDASVSQLLFGFSNQSLIDNAYLDIMTFGGGVLLFYFVIFQIASILACIRSRLDLGLLLHGLFFISMLTTNVPRLWPTGYMYWALIGISLQQWLRTERYWFINKNSNCQNLKEN